MHLWSVAVHQDAPYFPSRRDLAFARTDVLRDACFVSPKRERGACRYAVGSACACLRRLMRVFTRPVLGRSSRYDIQELRCDRQG